MPRGRAGLMMIDPLSVRDAIMAHFPYEYPPYGKSRAERVAITFGVNQRTVRRWCNVGLALCYGDDKKPSYITRERWEEFKKTGKVSVSQGSCQNGQVSSNTPVRSRRRTRVDRHLSTPPARPKRGK